MKRVLYFGAKNNRCIGDGNNTRIARYASISNLKWVYHPECTKRLILGIIQTVTEANESHRLLADLRRQNGMVKSMACLSICILLILPSVIINDKDYFAKTRLILNFHAHISCKND